ncbi:MAG: tyrosine-type recombinase/integrase, partial [Trebonia sp.]
MYLLVVSSESGPSQSAIVAVATGCGALSRRIAAVCLLRGIPRNRHSRAMHLYDAGVPLPYIRDILGHVDLSTTDIYARAST